MFIVSNDLWDISNYADVCYVVQEHMNYFKLIKINILHSISQTHPQIIS